MPNPLENAILYCQEKAAPDLSSLYYATLFLGLRRKAFWLGLFALKHELLHAARSTLDPALVPIKLGWWTNAIADVLNTAQPNLLLTNTPHKNAHHPTTAAQTENTTSTRKASGQLHPVLRAIGSDCLQALSHDAWQVLINNTLDATEPKRHNTQQDWDTHTLTGIQPWWPLVAKHAGLDHACDASTSQTTLQWWVKSIQITQVLRMAKHLEHNIQPIPLNMLQQHHVTADMLKNRQHNPATQALLHHVFDSIYGASKTLYASMPKNHRKAIAPIAAMWRMRCMEGKQQQDWAILTHHTPLSTFQKFKALFWVA